MFTYLFGILLILLFISIIVVIIVSINNNDDKNNCKHESFTPKTLCAIVCVYNREDRLHITLDSIVKQSVFENMKIIIINDCSTDNSINIINEYAQKYNNIYVINHKINEGILISRLDGVLSHYNDCYYTTFVDADDTIDERYYEEMLQYDSDIVQGNNTVVEVKNKKNIWKKYGRLQKDETININNNIPIKYLNKLSLVVWDKIYKTNILRNVCRYIDRIRCNYSEDLLINGLVYSQIKSFTVIDNKYCYTYYCNNPESMIHKGTTFIYKSKNVTNIFSMLWKILHDKLNVKYSYYNNYILSLSTKWISLSNSMM